MMKLMKSLMISCKKASFLIAKKEERKLTFGEHIHLTMHLSMCEFCKAFEKQSAYISKQAKNFLSSAELTPEDKIRILKSLEK
jgi:predicted anti-sigma-YlaC factor YlaD